MKRRTPPESPVLFDLAPSVPDFSLEEAARRDGFACIAGADEAGRGPLAGPVVAAAVVLDATCIPDGLNDSKKLTAAQREALFKQILAVADVSVASSGPKRIDDTDIRKASLEAMRRAVSGLPCRADYVLVDGRDPVPGLWCPSKAVIKGDGRSLSIAAASIVAKVLRDRMMARAGLTFPAYGFEIHAGYATARHRSSIDLHGPCPLHRLTFRPVRADADEVVE